MTIFANGTIRFRWLAILVSSGSLLANSTGSAQSPVDVTGLVTDTVGTPIFGAIVSVTGTSLTSRTNDRGEYHLRGVSPGAVEIAARRLGFKPSARVLQLGQQTQHRVQFQLAELPTAVRPVVVQAGRVEYSGRLAGYYQRLRRRSGGQFIDRFEIDRQQARTLSQLLGQHPGVNAHRMKSGGGAVRMRGRACRPLVWLDGVPMPAGEVDLDAFPLSTLHGIELYLGSTQAPFDYTASQGMSNCGTILLWSRGRDTEAAGRVRERLFDLEKMAESLSVFTADQVDTPAVLKTPASLEVSYPAPLFASGIGGSVVAEFVVGVRGMIEPETFAIVSATHPLFGAAVAQALESVTYSPAIRKGSPVRQVVHQRFEFSASDKPAKLSTLPGR